jgi:hypothetical protein
MPGALLLGRGEHVADEARIGAIFIGIAALAAQCSVAATSLIARNRKRAYGAAISATSRLRRADRASTRAESGHAFCIETPTEVAGALRMNGERIAGRAER